MRQKNEQTVQNKQDRLLKKDSRDEEKEDIRRGQEGMDAEGNTHSKEKLINPLKGSAGKKKMPVPVEKNIKHG